MGSDVGEAQSGPDTPMGPIGGGSLGRIRKAVAELSALSASTALSMVFAFAVQVFLTRALSPEGYGALTAALAAITLVSPIAGYGVGKYWLRVFGAHGWEGRAWFRPTITLAAIGTAVAASIVVLWSQLAALDRSIATAALILLPSLILYPASETFYAKLQVEANYTGLAVRQLLPNLVRLVVAGLALVLGLQLLELAIFLSLTLTVLAFLFCVEVFKVAKGNLRLAGHGMKQATAPTLAPSLKEVGQAAWPFALSGAFYLIYYQSDVMLLGWLAGPVAAGTYNVAFAVMAAVFMIPSVFHQKYLLPKLHRWVEHDKPKLLAVYRFGNGATLALGFIMALLVYTLSPVAIQFVFGNEYAGAGQVMKLLAIAIPGRYLATSVGAVLATEDNMRRKVWLMGLTAVVNLSLNLVLIPRYGIYGAAWATVVSETLLVVCYLAAVKRYVFGADALRHWTVVPGGWN